MSSPTSGGQRLKPVARRGRACRPMAMTSSNPAVVRMPRGLLSVYARHWFLPAGGKPRLPAPERFAARPGGRLPQDCGAWKDFQYANSAVSPVCTVGECAACVDGNAYRVKVSFRSCRAIARFSARNVVSDAVSGSLNPLTPVVFRIRRRDTSARCTKQRRVGLSKNFQNSRKTNRPSPTQASGVLPLLKLNQPHRNR